MSLVLEYNGESRTLSGWGLSGATLRRTNQDTDSLVLVASVNDVFADPIFAYGEKVRLYRNGVGIFTGTVSRRTVSADGTKQSHSYECLGPWWQLRRTIYRQPRAIFDSGFAALVAVSTSKITFGQNNWGQKQTTDLQISDICFVAASQNPGLFLQPSLPILVEPVLEEARDISCAAAIQRMLAYTPDVVLSWDYSTTIPTMLIQRRSALPAVTIDRAGGTLVGGLASLTARPDLVPPGVVFTFLRQEKNPADPDGPLLTRTTVQTAGTSEGPGVIYATIELSLQGTDQAEAVPAGLAAAYYTSMQDLHWEGVVTLQERQCSGLVGVGNRLNIANGNAAWATMNAVVQDSEEDLFTGRTTLRLGPPEHLSPQDFAAMMERWRAGRPAGPGAASQHNGTEGYGDVGPDPDTLEGEREGNEDAGRGSGASAAGLFSTVDLDVCDGSTPKTVRVLGQVIT